MNEDEHPAERNDQGNGAIRRVRERRARMRMNVDMDDGRELERALKRT